MARNDAIEEVRPYKVNFDICMFMYINIHSKYTYESTLAKML